MDISIFDAYWADRQPDRSDMADFWTRRASSFNAHGGEADSSAYRKALVARVAARTGLGRHDAVLDVGCGPGRHALEFAQLTGHVEGSDIAPGMIECARANAAGAMVDNAHFQVLDWAEADLEALGWVKCFNLVFASRTPAIYDRSTLNKMTEASSGYCCLLTQVTGDNSVRRELCPIAGDDRREDMTRRGLYCAFNILWLQGYYPEVEYLERSWDSECSLDEAILMYTRHFNSRGQLSEGQQAAIADKLREISRDGTVREQGHSRVAMLLWKVCP
ncbi:MAG: class I SAM-dependent methyltransferase [Desulfovibrio sp.]|uniref:class I SAM-dependent methyltransferase n=1 Tax=Desulfovibrio sp. TaxID=885 RepID=UPI00135EFFA6|nr:class I SAM-dependent methyltransferase [Desulfovibrio sp.]MTJ92637.1 class I SAM-dependent methyltransferase [Desulfovibrio sp.]